MNEAAMYKQVGNLLDKPENICRHFQTRHDNKERSVSFEDEVKFETKVRAQYSFLEQINILPVMGDSPRKVGFTDVASEPLLSRADTKAGGQRNAYPIYRKPKRGIQFHTTQLDLQRHFDDIDAMIAVGGIEQLYEEQVWQQLALGRITVGFHGERAEKQTDRTVFPRLDDLQRGWLQGIREDAPEQLLGVDGKPIHIGQGGDFKTIEYVTEHLVNTKLNAWVGDSSNLIVLVGGQLWRDFHTKHVLAGQRASYIAGIPAFTLVGFPPKGLVITTLENLSIYWEKGSHLRHVLAHPDDETLQDYISIKECYLVENYEKITGLDFKAVEIV